MALKKHRLPNSTVAFVGILRGHEKLVSSIWYMTVEYCNTNI